MRLRDPNACPERGDTVVGDCWLRATVAHRVSLAGLSDRLEFMAQRGVPIDTMPDALRAQAAVWRAMTGAQRVELAWSMSEELRSLSMQGIRARNPEQLLSDIEEVVITTDTMASTLEELAPYEQLTGLSLT